MRKYFAFFSVISALLCPPPGHAQMDQNDEAFGAGMGRAEHEVTEVNPGVLSSTIDISPQIGVFGFADGLNHFTGRSLQGVTLDMKILPSLFGLRMSHVSLGTGLLFSHLGAPGSNFFGTNSPFPVGFGSNSIIIPLNVAAGVRLSDQFLLTGSVGTAAIYRSISDTVKFGRASDLSTGSSTEFFPTLGLNLGWEVSKNIALALRGDYILTPATDAFTASLGATFPLA